MVLIDSMHTSNFFTSKITGTLGMSTFKRQQKSISGLSQPNTIRLGVIERDFLAAGVSEKSVNGGVTTLSAGLGTFEGRGISRTELDDG